MSGIYQIYNPINNKRYIGSSINVERRLKEHLRNLEKNRHCNDHLQSAYNKYKDVLQFQFLEECEPDECLIFEQYYLDYYKSYIREFVSSYQAAKILNCDQGHIRRCCQHKEGRKQHKGYIFKYKEELI